jgi:predicted Zn-dependent protease
MRNRQRMTLRLFLAGVVCVLLAPHAWAQSQDDAIGRAMRDELVRSMDKLRLAQLERPYFIAYRVRERQGMTVSATGGSLLGGEEFRARTLTVELRVGDYAFDNTNFFSFSGFSPGSMRVWFGITELPLDDDYLEIRRQIWLATDSAYKQALEDLAGKQAALQDKARPQNLPDFTKEEPAQIDDEQPPVQMKRAAAEALVRDLSRILGRSPDIYKSEVVVQVLNVHTRFLSSEGTAYLQSRPLVTLAASASTQAPDGMPLANSVDFYTVSTDSSLIREQFGVRVQDLASQLESLRKAPPAVEHYNGPILFADRAAAQLFSEEFAPLLVAQRKPVSGNPELDMAFEGMLHRGRPSFADKIGARVLPDFLNVVDDPTLQDYNKEPLLGNYKVDADGVRTQKTSLVEGGILKTLLTTRNPVEGIAHSTGSRRGGSAAPSNLIVTADRGPSDAELKNQLVALVKKRGLAYGILVRDVGSGSGTNMQEQALAMISAMTGQGDRGKSLLLTYRVYPDGREELFRGARLTGLGPESFKEIVATSSSGFLYNSVRTPDITAAMRGSFAEGETSMPLVSYLVPSLLFEDLTLSNPSEELPKPPFSNPPPGKE